MFGETDFGLSYRTVTDSYGYLGVVIEGKHIEDILTGVSAVEDKGFSDELLVTIFEFSSNIDGNNNSIQ